MSEERTESGIIIASQTGVQRQWRIRVMSTDPTLIDDTSKFSGTPTEAHARAYILARRTSYMVNGPNRRVKGYVEGYSPKTRQWVRVFEFITKLRDGAEPV